MIEVDPSHLAEICRILAGHVPNCEVRAFGSRVSGAAKPYSDLDLAIVGPERLELRSMGALREAFEASTLPFRVDLLDWNAISPSFREVIAAKFVVVQKPADGSEPSI